MLRWIEIKFKYKDEKYIKHINDVALFKLRRDLI